MRSELWAGLSSGAFGLVAAVLVMLAVGVALRVSGRLLPGSLMPWYFPTQVLAAGVSMAATSRYFDALGMSVGPAPTSTFWGEWAIRLASIVALLGATDALLRQLRTGEKPVSWRLLLMLGFCMLWATQVGMPAVWGRHPQFQSYWLYALWVGLGLLALDAEDARRTMNGFRDAQLAFCVVSLLLVPLWPSFALQLDYAQGVLGGVPRLVGLAPHPIALAGVAVSTLLIVLCRPYQRPWLQVAAIVVCGVVIFFAQSKTVWLLTLVAVPVVGWYQGKWPSFWILSRPTWRLPVALMSGALALALVLILGFSLSGRLDAGWDHYLSTPEGEQLLTLTGRDRIWAVALEEWQQDRIFGYGMPLLNEAHRAVLQMGAATHAHNQFVDSLARSGLIGLAGAVVYMVLVSVTAWRLARPTGGLSVGLLLVLWVFSATEVPLSLTGIGLTNFYHLGLLAVLGAGVAAQRAHSKGRA